MLQRRPNRTELRSIDSHSQMLPFIRKRNTKAEVPKEGTYFISHSISIPGIFLNKKVGFRKN